MTAKIQWLERFNLNWKVEKRPLYTTDATGQNAVKLTQQALVRTDSNKVLNVVTPRYEPIQNDSFADLLMDGEARGLLKNLSGGGFSGGGKVWVQAEFGSGGAVGKSDEVKSRLLVATSHDGSFSFRSTLSPVRVICMNTLMAAISHETRVSFKHTASAGQRLNDLQIALNKLDFDFKKTMDLYNHFASVQMTTAALEAYFKEILKVDAGAELTEQQGDRMSTLIRLFESGIGQELNRGTLWSAFNAVTEYTSHKLGTAEKREESVLFGKGQELNTVALKAAIKLVA